MRTHSVLDRFLNSSYSLENRKLNVSADALRSSADALRKFCRKSRKGNLEPKGIWSRCDPDHTHSSPVRTHWTRRQPEIRIFKRFSILGFQGTRFRRPKIAMAVWGVHPLTPLLSSKLGKAFGYKRRRISSLSSSINISIFPKIERERSCRNSRRLFKEGEEEDSSKESARSRFLI